VKKIIFTAVAFALIACGPAKQEQTQTSATTESSTAAVTATTATETAATATTGTAAAPAPASTASEEKPMTDTKDKVAELHTSAGEIDIRFFPDVAPNHVRNFIELASKGFYNGTKFHRVIPGFMVQGGDPNTKTSDTNAWGQGGSGKNLKAEFNKIPHKRGIVSMARAQDPDSASSQFFIVVKDSNFLDNQYTAFGQVTKGMDVADKIVNAPRGASDRPNNPTTIDSITLRDAKADEKEPTPK
jgi:peptidyl-prolyl cis-trans isomerase B (cyclophilin B)